MISTPIAMIVGTCSDDDYNSYDGANDDDYNGYDHDNDDYNSQDDDNNDNDKYDKDNDGYDDYDDDDDFLHFSAITHQVQSCLLMIG